MTNKKIKSKKIEFSIHIQSEEFEQSKKESDIKKFENINDEKSTVSRKVEMEKIAKDYYNHLNGTLSFIMLGIYFSIIELKYFQIYAILTSFLFAVYITFNFKEYTTVAKEYLAQFSGIEKITNTLRLFIFFIAFTLLLTAAIGCKVFESISNWVL